MTGRARHLVSCGLTYRTTRSSSRPPNRQIEVRPEVLVDQVYKLGERQADQLFFDQIIEAAVTDDGLRQAAAVNPEDKFELVFRNLLERLFVERMDLNEEIFMRFMNDAHFRKVVTTWMAEEAYRRLRSAKRQLIRLGDIPGCFLGSLEIDLARPRHKFAFKRLRPPMLIP